MLWRIGQDRLGEDVGGKRWYQEMTVSISREIALLPPQQWLAQLLHVLLAG